MSAAVLALPTAAGAPVPQQRRRGPLPRSVSQLSKVRRERRQAQQRQKQADELRGYLAGMRMVSNDQRRELLLPDHALAAKRRAWLIDALKVAAEHEAKLAAELAALVADA
jgi:hypothetical protein